MTWTSHCSMAYFDILSKEGEGTEDSFFTIPWVNLLLEVIVLSTPQQGKISFLVAVHAGIIRFRMNHFDSFWRNQQFETHRQRWHPVLICIYLLSVSNTLIYLVVLSTNTSTNGAFGAAYSLHCFLSPSQDCPRTCCMSRRLCLRVTDACGYRVASAQG